jgi:uncharacterized damage-inducible protein DinB
MNTEISSSKRIEEENPMLDLNQIRKELLGEIADVSDEDASWRFAEGEWSIAQVLEHIYLVERAIASQLKHGLFEESETPFPEKPLDLLLDRTQKIHVASPHLEPKSEFQTLDQLKEKLAKSRQQLLEANSQMDEFSMTNKALSFPTLGQLPLAQWVQVAAAHEKRHIEQIKEIKQRLFLRQI